MGQPQRTEIDVFFSRGQPYEQRVSWPVLQSTEKAWLIQTFIPMGPHAYCTWRLRQRAEAERGFGLPPQHHVYAS